MSIEGIALDHVAIAVPRIAGVIDAVGGTMGGKRHLAGPGQGFVFAQWAYRRGELVEVIEPEVLRSRLVETMRDSLAQTMQAISTESAEE